MSCSKYEKPESTLEAIFLYFLQLTFLLFIPQEHRSKLQSDMKLLLQNNPIISNMDPKLIQSYAIAYIEGIDYNHRAKAIIDRQLKKIKPFMQPAGRGLKL